MIVSENFDELFAEDEHSEPELEAEQWKVLVVDDEEDIYTVTRLALQNFSFRSRKLKILDAYSAAEARKVMEDHPDIAMILLDVVMESSQAGLELVDYIRDNLSNRSVRIILRTGQPVWRPKKKWSNNIILMTTRVKRSLPLINFFQPLSPASGPMMR